ncbi:hypothetical protein [Streptomyces sp. NPDC090798]|uniref:hypothetical protein n=1 Tax=Streptomyces sp. NPDC090798 TaxID=3365968 RepID=UPI0037F2943F
MAKALRVQAGALGVPAAAVDGFGGFELHPRTARTPKGSSKAQLLEAKDNLQRMLASMPLSDEERAAVDDGQDALDQLLGRLADVPTPSGPTPRELDVPPSAALLPIVEVNQRFGRDTAGRDAAADDRRVRPGR